MSGADEEGPEEPEEPEERHERPRLWFAPDRSRFFLLPTGPLPRGDFEIRSLAASTASADEDWLREHEVDAEAARAHVDAGWEEAAGQLRDTWRRLVGGETSGDAPDLARWLGVTPGEMVTDRAKQREGKRALLGTAMRWLRPRTTDADIDRAEEQLDTFAARLERDAERLRTRGSELARERGPELQATVEDVGRQVTDAGRSILDRLRSRGESPEEAPPDEVSPDPEDTPE